MTIPTSVDYTNNTLFRGIPYELLAWVEALVEEIVLGSGDLIFE